MKKRKKKGGENKALEAIVFATAIFELVRAVIELITRLNE